MTNFPTTPGLWNFQVIPYWVNWVSSSARAAVTSLGTTSASPNNRGRLFREMFSFQIMFLYTAHRQAAGTAKPGIMSCELRHHVGSPVLSFGKRIRLLRKIADKLLLLRIERYPGAERGRGGTEIDAIFAQILAAAIKCI